MTDVPPPPFLESLGHGVYAVDTGFQRPRFDAAYLLVHQGRGAFIDTGTNFAVPRLLASLAALGLSRDDVDYVIPTHVHLDHAGGAGALMQHLPRAHLWVHARGARHMIDPSALYQGALAVYGQDEMDRSYGQLVGVDPARLSTTQEGQVIELAGRPLRFVDAPGHARHHHAIWDEASRGWFTGDTFGLSYREFDTSRGPWILPTSTPVQFEPEVLKQTIRRLLSVDPQCMYLTHYGRITDVPRMGSMLLEQLDRMVALGLSLRDAPQRHEELKQGMLAIILQGLAEHGCTLGAAEVERLLTMDLELNAQGLAIWLDR